MTIDELKTVVKYDPDTGDFTRLVKIGVFDVGSKCGGVNKRGYLLIRVLGRRYAAHRLAWFYMTGEWPDETVDHRNGIKTDNRYCNLRKASIGQNILNRKNSNSEFPGTSRSGKKWLANANLNGKRYRIGIFETREMASNAYINFIKQKHGDFFFDGYNCKPAA